MRDLKIVLADFFRLCAVCGPLLAVRWLWAVFTHLPACKRSGNLQPADAALGDGPFAVRRGAARARLYGHCVMTGLREIWARDVYLDGGYLAIVPDATVLDLGANMGNFTALAMGHGPAVRVISVEADPLECARFEQNMAVNGWKERAHLINAFVGGMADFQRNLRQNPKAASVPAITPREILDLLGGSRISFLKCDIEGSEFELFAGRSPLLDAADQLAIEIHPTFGDARALIEKIANSGFEIREDHRPPTINVLGRRVAAPAASRP